MNFAAHHRCVALKEPPPPVPTSNAVECNCLSTDGREMYFFGCWVLVRAEQLPLCSRVMLLPLCNAQAKKFYKNQRYTILMCGSAFVHSTDESMQKDWYSSIYINKHDDLKEILCIGQSQCSWGSMHLRQCNVPQPLTQ
uniref:Uncharacterized protein n=1 Tax=Eutreptiella gymnastica TaxID=73025 RepID=A0A7S4C752_9EUGL